MSTEEFQALLADLGWLRTLARRLARDANAAEDLVQDACAIALRQPAPPLQWRAWLTEVLRNLVRAERRRGARQQRQLAALESPTEPDALSTLQRVESQQRLVAAVMQLEEPYRTTVLLRFFDGLPPRRIAQRQRVPVATVHSRLQRALQQLRERLDREYGARSAWLAAFAPFAWPAVRPMAGRGAPLASKPAVLAAIVVVVGVGAAWWGSRTSADPGTLAPAVVAPRVVAASESAAAADVAPAERQLVVAAEQPKVAATHRVSGFVCDLQGKAMPNLVVAAMPGETRAEVERVRRTVRLGTTDAAGRFQGELAAEAALLATLGNEHATVLLGQWTHTATVQPVVVVAPAIELAGWLVDEHGQPVGEGQVELELPDGLLARLSMRLDRTLASHWQTPVAPDGAFRLAAVPSVDGAWLRATVAGRGQVRAPAPTSSRRDVRLVLGGSEYRGELLRGRVVRADGGAAAGARVAMGITSCTTDARGEFALPLGRAGAPTDLVAALPGLVPARVPMPSTGAASSGSWPAPLVLQLGPPTGSLVGRVVAPDGAPVDGAEVWLADPSPFGADGCRIVNLEPFLAGSPTWSRSQPEPSLDPALVDAPLSAQSQRTTWGHEVQPTATWHFVTTDAAGRFTLEGLLPRSYQVRAFDVVSGCFAIAADVRAGDQLELVLATDEVAAQLRGHVRSRHGAPIEGVRVQQKFVPFVAEGPIAGGSFRWVFLRDGRATTTDADGAFVLRDVGRRDTYLHLEGDRIMPKPIQASAITAGRPMALVADLRCAVEVQLADARQADRVRCEDADGKPAMLVLANVNAMSFLASVPLHDGRSGTFFVGESAASLLLLRGDEVVRTIPIQPDPTRTTQVQ